MQLFYSELVYPKMIASCETGMFRHDKTISNYIFSSLFITCGGKKLIETPKIFSKEL